MNAINYLKLLSTIITKKGLMYVHFGLTHRCNLQCRMCNIWRSADKAQELSFAQIKTLADSLKSLGVNVISLGGGEPFLREDLKEIIKLFLKKGFLVRLLTNGTLFREKDLGELIQLGLNNISVSLDTLSPEKQSYICNQEGIWDKIIDSMVLISNLFPRRGSFLLVNTTVSRLNIEELPRLAQFASKLGYYISFIPLESFAERDSRSSSDTDFSEFQITLQDNELVDKIYGQLIEMKAKKNNIFNSTRFLEDSRDFLKTSQMNWQCDAGRLYFSLDPKGDFSICHRFHSDRGLDYNLEVLLKSQMFRSKQHKLTKDCPGCMRPCWAEITHLVRDKRSFWEMAKIEISTLKKRKKVVDREAIDRVLKEIMCQ
jgi:MoaA/NifB/PqqE/SkfB family radical SAM enzyme